MDASLPVRLAFYGHVALASLALLLGPWQFSHRLRRRWPVAHRSVGVAYLLTVGVASVCALVMAPFNLARMAGFFGFGALALLWAYTAWRGFDTARRRDVRQHQAWMIRNYAQRDRRRVADPPTRAAVVPARGPGAGVEDC